VTGLPYSKTLEVNETATWSGSGLPAWIEINSSTGVLSGTPTTADTYSFTVTATDTAGNSSAAKSLSITITAAPTAPTITTASLPNGTVGIAYSQTLTASGTSPITWTSGDNPVWLSISSAGVLSGTPTTAGAYTFNVTATNGTDPNDTQELTIIVKGQPSVSVSGSFDKNPTNQADVASTITWQNAGSITTVKVGTTSIGASNWSVSGTTLTINKSYLATQAKGTLALTVEFDIGTSATLNINITDTTPPTISPTSRSFDVNAPADMVTSITWNSAETVTSAVYSTGSDVTVYPLTVNSDYAVSGNTFTIKSGFFTGGSFTTGASLTFTLTFDTGAIVALTVNVTDSYVPSTNNDLASLSVNETPVSGFAAGTTTYSVELPYGSGTATVTAVAADAHASVTISPTPPMSVPGTATVTVTAESGATKTYTVNIAVAASPVTFVAVSTISGVPTSMTAGTPLTLSGTIAPANATNQTIVWSVKDAGGTGASVSGSTLSATTAGTVVVTATVVNGATESTNYTQDFTIAVNARSGGDGGGNNTPSTPTTPAESGYKADLDAGSGTDTTVLVKVDDKTGTATVDIGSGIIGGGRTSVVTVPSIPDVDTITVGIPVPDLKAANGQSKLTIETDAGSVTVPSNMLTGVNGTNGNKAEITIAEGDKDSLPPALKAIIGDKPLIQLTLSIDGKQTDWNNSKAPVTVSIPYTPTAEELRHPNCIVVWYIDGDGKAVPMPNGHYDAKIGTVTFTTTHFSDYTVAYKNVSFNDVSDTAWYAPAVSFIAAREITSGTGNNKYSPVAKLTRGEFIALVMRTYGIAPDENPTDNFSNAGNEVTRQEMFTLLYNVLKTIGQLPTGSSGKTLSDFTDRGEIASWAHEAMTLLVETGTIGGNNGMLTPDGTTTRAEMAQVLYNLLGK
jgi:hypothetical protein